MRDFLSRFLRNLQYPVPPNFGGRLRCLVCTEPPVLVRFGQIVFFLEGFYAKTGVLGWFFLIFLAIFCILYRGTFGHRFQGLRGGCVFIFRWMNVWMFLYLNLFLFFFNMQYFPRTIRVKSSVRPKYDTTCVKMDADGDKCAVLLTKTWEKSATPHFDVEAFKSQWHFTCDCGKF